MLTDLLAQIRRYDLLQPGDSVVCAVSGGADSMALLWGLYLLREKLEIRLSAAHFNHNLRGEESHRDEQFVREFCHRFDIPLAVGSAQVRPGKKGLEAAARDARYGFFATLPGKIATAHTADDNAETVLLHLVRGTGLKGLGGIAPKNGAYIRPMLNITRQQVLSFLEEYHVSFVEDSSNGGDDFLRNRLRHRVMPLLRQENPSFAENTSSMAQLLRQDEACLEALSPREMPDVPALRRMEPALRSRVLARFLTESGVREPESAHVALAEQLVFSHKPSARGDFPGGVTVRRNYDTLEAVSSPKTFEEAVLPEGGVLELPELGLRVLWENANDLENTKDHFTVAPQGPILLRPRRTGDTISLPGGSKSLKKLLIDRKIPAARREAIPVVADEKGILGVYGIGVDEKRKATALPAVRIRFETIESSETL